MAELIGITKISAQMKEVLIGKTIEELSLLQKKSLNVSAEIFQRLTKGATITDVYHQGRWIVTALDNNEHLLLSFKLGSDIFYFENNDNKQKNIK